jgi:hypothetical protein
MDVRFGIWNIGSSYRTGLLVTVSKESKYKLGLVGVQVRWEGSGTKLAGDSVTVPNLCSQ